MATRRNRHSILPGARQDTIPQTPDDLCYTKARKFGMPTFTLIGSDPTAPAVIREWAKRAAALGSPALKVGTAMLDAAAFDRWQVRNGSKIPD